MRISDVVARAVRNWPAKVISLAVAVALLVVHDITQLQERFITVPLELLLDEALTPSGSVPRQVRVRLRGEEEDVFRLVEDDVRASIDLSDVSGEGEYRAPVQLALVDRDAVRGELELVAEPESIAVVLEDRIVRSVPVVPATVGFPPSGYELSSLSAAPSSVEIAGPRSVVAPIEEIATEELDVSNREQTFSERVRLVRPESVVAFPGGDVVEVRGVVEEIITLRTFEAVPMIVTGLPPGFRLAQALPAGLIRAQGRQVDLETVSSNDVQLLVDASSIDEGGTIRLPVQPITPPGFVILRYEPTSVQLIVEVAQ